jgi:uncharacterized protein YacL
MQTKTQSFIETIVNLVIGMIVSFLAQKTIFPYFDLHVSTHKNILITLIFTIISFVRGYGLRRFFNWFFNKKQIKNHNTEMVDFVLNEFENCDPTKANYTKKQFIKLILNKANQLNQKR